MGRPALLQVGEAEGPRPARDAVAKCRCYCDAFAVRKIPPFLPPVKPRQDFFSSRPCTGPARQRTITHGLPLQLQTAVAYSNASPTLSGPCRGTNLHRCTPALRGLRTVGSTSSARAGLQKGCIRPLGPDSWQGICSPPLADWLLVRPIAQGVKATGICPRPCLECTAAAHIGCVRCWKQSCPRTRAALQRNTTAGTPSTPTGTELA